MTISKEAQEQSNLWEVDTLATTLHIAKQLLEQALVSRVERNGAWCLGLELELELGLGLGLELGLGKLDSRELAHTMYDALVDLTVRTVDTIVPAGNSISLVNLTVKKRPLLQ